MTKGKLKWGWLPVVALLAGMLTAPEARAAGQEWTIDVGHTNIGFSVKHMFSNTTGRFDQFSGTLTLDPKTGTLSAVRGEINTASVNTNHEKRDGHLRSPDFFNVEKHPTMTFVAKKFHTDGDVQHVTGDFTLLGVTKPVTFTVRYLGAGTDPWGGTRAGLTATTTIDRRDFGMKWSKLLDNGGLVVGNDVTISLEIEAMVKK
ncbi:MAG: YceI family protein [Nitrospirota bacterium]|nr:YceI family protein [Nitrospirota bacterium]